MSWLPSKCQEWAAFISIMQFIVVVIGLLYARRQQREVMRSRSLNAAKQMLDEISTPTLRNARTYVLDPSELPGDLSNVGEEELEIIRSVAVVYDRVGCIIKQGLIPEKDLFDFRRDEIEQLRQKLSQFLGDSLGQGESALNAVG
jgi:hypothetical protein